MDHSIILKEFYEIKKKGWIKGIRKGPTNVGATLEASLEIKENTFSYPDYFGYEIKTKRKDQNYYITLFNCSPLGLHESENNRLRLTYGYPDRKDRNKLVFNISLYANKKCNVGYKYKAELFINSKNETINLLIYDKNNTLIDWNTKWTFSMLKEKIFDKCENMVFIVAERKYINGNEYFKYSDIMLYKIKDFNTFIHLIEIGIIRISFKLGVFRSGPRSGQTHDHGTGFEILEKDLEKLYNRLY